MTSTTLQIAGVDVDMLCLAAQIPASTLLRISRYFITATIRCHRGGRGGRLSAADRRRLMLVLGMLHRALDEGVPVTRTKGDPPPDTKPTLRVIEGGRRHG